MKNKMLLGIITTACLTCLAVPGVHAGLLGKAMKAGAAGAAAARVYRSTVASAGALTVPMLEECIRIEKTIDTSYTKLEKMDSRIDAMEEELTKLGDYINTHKDTVDTSSQQAVDFFNGKVAEYQGKAGEFDQLIDDRSNVFTPYQAATAKYEGQCNGQKYYEDDYEKALKNVESGMRWTKPGI